MLFNDYVIGSSEILPHITKKGVFGWLKKVLATKNKKTQIVIHTNKKK